MLNFNNHYKELNPEQTIENVRNFFNEKGFTIKLVDFKKSEIGTYSCCYKLYYNNEYILVASGKGMTEVYSQASCFGELYERFCGFRLCNLLNPIINNFTSELRFKKYGYYYYKNEKKLSIEDLKNDIYAKQLFDYYLPENNIKFIQQFVEIFFNNKIYGLPFQNIFNQNDIKYYNLNIAKYFTDTTGLATGNTINEALIQGSSEIYERICIEKFFSNIQTKYYYLNLNNLNNNLQILINNIIALGYNIKIYDLSYNFNLPVCMTIIYDLKNGIFQFNFGAFPIVDIAIERTLTELYQGFATLPNNTELIKEYNNTYINKLSHATSRSSNIKREYIIPQYLFNDEEVDTYNHNIFYNNLTITNNNILLNQIQYINTINNLKFYYLDISMHDKVKAVAILTDQLYRINTNIYKFEYLKKYSKEEKELILSIMQYLIKSLKSIIDLSINITSYNNTQIFLTNLLNLFQVLQQHPIAILDKHPQLSFFINHLLYPFNCFLDVLGDEKNLFIILMETFKNQIKFQYYSEYRNKYNQFILNNEDISQYLFQNIYNIPSNMEDPIIRFQFIYLQTIYNIYNSQTFQNFIKTLI